MHLLRLLALALLLPGTALAQVAPASSSKAVAELRALHEKVMRAHRESNKEVLLEDEAVDYVVASRGEISRPTIQQRRERLGAYLKASSFSESRDLVEPIVSVSADSSMGWVVVQVSARGKQLTKTGEEVPLEFVSAWIELYERRGEKWQRTGNISNFKP
jgi:hypothetical protein